MFDLAKIGRDLPVSRVIDQLPDKGPLVVEAPPGTGKTTLVPPAIANKVGKTLVTAPRRVAVRAAAQRLAHLSDSAKVGYSIRGEHKDGELVEFVTPGVLLNRLLKDPGLEGVNAVVIDEVHERQLDTDLVLAMCMEVALLRDDLYLAAMSATLDAQKFADHMGAQVLSTEAVTHPLDIQYAPHPERIQGTKEFYRHVAAQTDSEHRTLVFVPGVREVDLVCGFLDDARPLHGRQTSKEQDESLRGTNRVVVATSVAESSITVPGVRKVVDAGLSRVPKRDNRGMTGLVTVSEAKTSADQRAGRAGREGPGEVVRVFSRDEYARMQPDITPEILTADLTGALLTMKAWGSPDLPLIDEPKDLTEAESNLEQLGATKNGKITEFGKKLARFPLDPRLGAALLEWGSQAAPIVARLAGDSPRLRRLVPDKGPVDPGEVIASAFPQWIAKKVGDEYQLASGTRAKFNSNAEWIAAAEVQRTHSGAVIREAEPIAFPEHRVVEETKAYLEDGKVRGRKVARIGAIELSSTPVKLTPDEAAEALTDVDFASFPLTKEEQHLKERLDFLHETLGWPDVSQGDYSVEVRGVAEGASISNCDMRQAMLRQLDWKQVAELDAAAPKEYQYGSGRPVKRVKLQHMFGQKGQTVSGVKVLYHLLSPAGRPLAVTDDLDSFWEGPYQQVRKEMRGRYPKHAWPEDPTGTGK
ncbi:ATP-dependent RNA helicase [Corynebacterium sp. HMSC034A01]|uniref:ATP-dependent RNA helicase n=1 Tax=Corynebacterium sp. HMSC034A01 TaxID=1739295 RepID=UPI0008A9DC40|nr:ATP-dependent helicase C-terminal domain-containing protein [Corynebacterium sp. HMSC034A01]OHR18465.1 ATP-dependent helicase HrpB [Corynebacterium sp. HMSC034A01]